MFGAILEEERKRQATASERGATRSPGNEPPAGDTHVERRALLDRRYLAGMTSADGTAIDVDGVAVDVESNSRLRGRLRTIGHVNTHENARPLPHSSPHENAIMASTGGVVAERRPVRPALRHPRRQRPRVAERVRRRGSNLFSSIDTSLPRTNASVWVTSRT